MFPWPGGGAGLTKGSHLEKQKQWKATPFGPMQWGEKSLVEQQAVWVVVCLRMSLSGPD